jgi:hypothetical protein
VHSAAHDQAIEHARIIIERELGTPLVTPGAAELKHTVSLPPFIVR